jgi:hypothetical protein
MLRPGVRPDERRGHPTPDGAGEHDARVRRALVAQDRQERLGDSDLADDVDLELTTYLVEVDELERPAHGDAGVVHDATQLQVAEVVAHGVGCGFGLLSRRDVESDGRDERVVVDRGQVANGGEHMGAVPGEAFDDGPADPGRGASDEDCVG